MTDQDDLSPSASPRGPRAAVAVVEQQIGRVLASSSVEDLSAACQAISDATPPLDSSDAIGGDPVRALVQVGRQAVGSVLEDGRFDLDTLKDGVLDPGATWAGYIDEASWAAVMLFLLDDDAEAWSSGVNPLLDLLVASAVALQTLSPVDWPENFASAATSSKDESFEASEVKKRANANWPQTNWASPLLKGAWVRLRNEREVLDGRVLGSRKLAGADVMVPVALIAGVGLHALRAAEGTRRLADPDDSTKEYVPMIAWPVEDAEEIPPHDPEALEWWVRAAWNREHL